jgi:hypothetical protein
MDRCREKKDVYTIGLPTLVYAEPAADAGSSQDDWKNLLPDVAQTIRQVHFVSGPRLGSLLGSLLYN